MPTCPDIDPVQSEIDRLRSIVRVYTERIAELQKLRSYPAVTPVLVYRRYNSKTRDEYIGGERDHDAVARAMDQLEVMLDDGMCSPEGVEVGGALIPYDR